MLKKIKSVAWLSGIIMSAVCFIVYGSDKSKKDIVIDGGKIIVEFDNNLKSRIISKLENEKVILGNFSNSEFVTINGKEVKNFQLTESRIKDIQDNLGKGKEYEIIGVSNNLTKKISVISYDDFPALLLFKVTYKNSGKENVTIDSWTNNNYSISAQPNQNNDPAFWSYQPGSYGWDNDWIIPLKEGYSRENYLGMNFVDYGGGTPVVNIWRRDCGLAVGHVEMVPKLISLPVSMPDKNTATLGVVFKKKIELKQGEDFSTLRTFAEVHHGDQFNSLTLYRQFMERQGIKFKEPPEDAYKSEWCGWGYEQDFTMEEYYGTFQKVKDIGLDWVVLDMGWYKGLGDYYLPKDKFPNGEEDMKKVVKDIHSYGLKAQLWWMPLSVAPNSDLMANHPEYLLINEDSSPHYMPSFFKAFFLCPASKEVREYTKQLVTKMMNWGWDGFKIDGNNLNAVPPCYNPAHHHAYPEESVEALPDFYKMVYETALSINPNAVIEICPCGTNQSFFNLPYMNQSVASDPHNSWHVRIKGKTLKALSNSKAVFYGDHVELSDDKSDFAATIGVGGVIGTKFVYPPGVHLNKETGDVTLTPEKEAEWRKWIKIYNDNMLSKGNYRGELYDMGFDRPETHAIQKGETMYYAFYAPDYDGQVELRGLENRNYKITDYENNIGLGEINGLVSKIKVSFKKHLLIKVEPK